MGTGEDYELAAIVPRSYCTRGIWARQEESAETGGASALISRERDDRQFGGKGQNPQPPQNHPERGKHALNRRVRRVGRRWN